MRRAWNCVWRHLFYFDHIHYDFIYMFVAGEHSEWMGVTGGPFLLTKTLRQLRSGAETDISQVRFSSHYHRETRACSSIDCTLDGVSQLRQREVRNSAQDIFIRRWLFFEALGLIFRFCVHAVLYFCKQTVSLIGIVHDRSVCVGHPRNRRKYRVSIKSFPDYRHLLQKNYCTWNTNFFFQTVTQEVFLQHISTLQHVLLLSHGERLIDNQFLFTCSPTCLQLL